MVCLRWTKSFFLCRFCPPIWNKDLQLRKTQRIRSIKVKSSDQQPLNDKMFCMESRLQWQHHVFSFTSRCSFIAISFYTVRHHPLSGTTFFFFTCSIFVISKGKTKESVVKSAMFLDRSDRRGASVGAAGFRVINTGQRTRMRKRGGKKVEKRKEEKIKEGGRSEQCVRFRLKLDSDPNASSSLPRMLFTCVSGGFSSFSVWRNSSTWSKNTKQNSQLKHCSHLQSNVLSPKLTTYFQGAQICAKSSIMPLSVPLRV